MICNDMFNLFPGDTKDTMACSLSYLFMLVTSIDIRNTSVFITNEINIEMNFCQKISYEYFFRRRLNVTWQFLRMKCDE